MLRFVTFEGVDGCGKTTQVRMLKQHLAIHQPTRPVRWVHDPGGTRIGDAVRQILLDRGNAMMRTECEVLLYCASRAQLVHETIGPAILRGDLVISDRFFDATVAYQGHGRNVDLGVLDFLHDYAAGGLIPDLTFLLDLDPEQGLERIVASRRGAAARGDRMEGQGTGFARRVRAGYLSLAAAHPDRFRVLDAAKSPDAIFSDVTSELHAHGV